MARILSKFKVKPTSIVRNNPNIELYEGEMIKVLKNTINYHIVKPMETLDSISSIYNINVDDIIAKNMLTSKRLFVGQRLIID